MRHLLLLVTILNLTLFSACKPKKDDSKIFESYSLIYASFVFSKEAQQKFIDKATESLNAIRYDKSIVIDTKELAVLLDSAKLANKSRLPFINRTEEIDDDIKYKEKVFNYVSLLDSLYNNEFSEYLKILDTKAEDRFEKSSQLLLPRLLQLKEVGQTCSDAGAAIRTKYEIQIVDNPSETK